MVKRKIILTIIYLALLWSLYLGLIVSFLPNFGLGLSHPFLGTTAEEESRNQSLEGEAY